MKLLLVILGFMWWWPLGLVALGYMLARGRFGGWRMPAFAGEAGERPMFDMSHRMDRWERKVARAQERVDRVRNRMERYTGRAGGWFTPSTSGNHAFDEYRTETLKRLEDEQKEFQDFLGRLRFARDRAEFDQFMNERRQQPSEPRPMQEPPAPHQG